MSTAAVRAAAAAPAAVRPAPPVWAVWAAGANPGLRSRCLPSPSPKGEGGLGRFKLAVHCGGCMIDQQKMRARIGGQGSCP